MRKTEKTSGVKSAKNIKAILFFSITSLVLIAAFFLLLAAHPATKYRPTASQPILVQTAAKVDPTKIEADYKVSVTAAVKEYADASGKNNLTPEEVSKTKNQLLALKVPTQFKDLHISLIMAMVKMESYFTSGNQADKALAEKTISEVERNYSWLN